MAISMAETFQGSLKLFYVNSDEDIKTDDCGRYEISLFQCW